MELEQWERKVLIIALIFFVAIAVYLTYSAAHDFKRPLDDCSHLTNETYDDYPNSINCRFNGTGWEPLFGTKKLYWVNR